MLENLHFTKELGYKSLDSLESGNLEEFARLMDVHWQRKKARSSGMSNDRINEWYDHAMQNMGRWEASSLGQVRRRLSDVFMPETKSACVTPCGRKACRRCGFASILKAPRSLHKTEARR